MYQKYRERGVIFIGLTDEDEGELSDIKAFLSDTVVTWPNGYGAAETLRAFDSPYIPAIWVIGPDGKVAWNDRSSGTLEDGIDKALTMLSNEERGIE